MNLSGEVLSSRWSEQILLIVFYVWNNLIKPIWKITNQLQNIYLKQSKITSNFTLSLLPQLGKRKWPKSYIFSSAFRFAVLRPLACISFNQLIFNLCAYLQTISNYKMEEKPVVVSQTQNQKIASRRSRKDEEGRDYQCGCGKRYLSYPALYTHIKTKHEGKQPEGTLKTGTSIITKRAKIKLEEETLKQIYATFDQFYPETILKIDESLKGTFPINARIKKDGVPKEIYDQYVQMTKQHEFKLSQNCSLEFALAVFLINMGELVNDKVYEQFLIFVRLARACFFDYGEQVYRAVFAKKDTGPFQMKDFSLQYARYFPLVADFFIRFYVREIDNKDTAEANRSLMQVIIFDFCHWLKIRKLTPLKVSLTANIEIDFKPSVQIKVKPVQGKAEQPKQAEVQGQFRYEKSIKEEVEEESEELSENEQIEEEIQNEDKNPSGSKENEQLE